MIALLLLSLGCLVTVKVLCLFLKVLWVGLQRVIVVIPDHTQFLFEPFETKIGQITVIP